MFNNIGGKIKALAKIICYVGIALSIISGIGVMVYAGDALENIPLAILGGIIVIGLGVLFSWIGSFVLYGYGELVESNTKIEENTRK